MLAFSGLFGACVGRPLYPRKQTLERVSLNVRLTPKSGRIWVTEFMPAYDPTRTSRLLAERVDSGNIFNLLGQRMKSGGLGVDYFGIIWA